MPHTNGEQVRRRDAILELLRDGPVTTQRRLVDQLTSRGLAVTQSSVSRDLKDIGAIKTAGGYSLPEPELDGVAEFEAIASLLRAARAAGPNLLVVSTAIGAAQRVALALDRSGWPEVVGCIGGDDTVFVATSSAGGQKQLVARIERFLVR